MDDIVLATEFITSHARSRSPVQKLIKDIKLRTHSANELPLVLLSRIGSIISILIKQSSLLFINSKTVGR